MVEENDINYELNKLINICIVNCIDDSERTLRFCQTRINLFESLIKREQENKPLFFQKKKLEEYNQKINEYNQKINDIYIEIKEERELINKLYNNMNI